MLSARAGSSDWSNCFDEGAFCHRRGLNISVSFFSARIWSHYSCGAPFLVLVIVMPSFPILFHLQKKVSLLCPAVC